MKIVSLETLVAVHTHTHTHTLVSLNDEKRVVENYSKSSALNLIDTINRL